MKNHWLKLSTLMAVVVGLSASNTVVRAEIVETHAPLHHAVFEMEKAISFMREAPHDFGGHRVAAIRDCEAAVGQLRVCLEAMHVGSVNIPLWENPERHPMRRAMIVLEEAKHHLERAGHDFHGHREKALLLCDAAIHQLRLAVEYRHR